MEEHRNVYFSTQFLSFFLIISEDYIGSMGHDKKCWEYPICNHAGDTEPSAKQHKKAMQSQTCPLDATVGDIPLLPFLGQMTQSGHL